MKDDPPSLSGAGLRLDKRMRRIWGVDELWFWSYFPLNTPNEAKNLWTSNIRRTFPNKILCDLRELCGYLYILSMVLASFSVFSGQPPYSDTLNYAKMEVESNGWRDQPHLTCMNLDLKTVCGKLRKFPVSL